MKYDKPEVAVLGEAIEVIESIPSKAVNSLDPGNTTGDPAYDLDE